MVLKGRPWAFAHGRFSVSRGDRMPEYLDIPTDDGHVVRIVYELSLGDLVIGSVLLLILTYMVIRTVTKIIWR